MAGEIKFPNVITMIFSQASDETKQNKKKGTTQNPASVDLETNVQPLAHTVIEIL